MMLNLSVPQEFRPQIGSRRTELFAWLLAIIMFLSSWFSPLKSSIGQLFTVILVGFFILSAGLISFGNWLDRRTYIRLTERGIEFRNGILNVRMDWEEIMEVRVFPSIQGNKVVIYSGHQHFSFQTLTELSSNGKVKVRYGFEKGEEIREMILRRLNLSDVEKRHTERYDYYLRE